MELPEVRASTLSGEIIATDVTLEAYMEHYAANYCEWVEGVVIKMSPVHLRHDDLFQYFILLLRIYFGFKRSGKVKVAPFVMELAPTIRREPDVQIILKDNPGRLTATAMIGAADICIEIVSKESIGRDYGDKFDEYERYGVREYWITDPLRQSARFYRRNEQGVFTHVLPDADGKYRTPLLLGFALDVATLWYKHLPEADEIMLAVKAMLDIDGD
jgi:Uma2 family endonuclease